ncbi:hypothetical protein ACH4E5_08990 [Streptomyces afghaniensis]
MSRATKETDKYEDDPTEAHADSPRMSAYRAHELPAHPSTIARPRDR